MIEYDCHIHTDFSDDSDTPAVEQIEEAIRIGYKGICITDHLDFEYPCEKEAGVKFMFDTDEYWKSLCKLKEEYSSKLELLIGVELGLRNEEGIISRMSSFYEDITAKYPLDFVIGSTHCLDNTDPYYPAYWNGKDYKTGLGAYFRACTENAANYDCFDSSGHFDYLVRYIPKGDTWHGAEDYKPDEFSDIIDEFLKTLIKRNKALECNTAGIKYGLGFAHPHEFILRRYLELGGELLTIGSDGHKPEHIVYDFDKTSEYLKALGFKYYTVYKQRKPVNYLL